VVFIGQRVACRDAPWDLFRARTDGMDLVQMTDCDDLAGIVVSPATGHVYYSSKGELRRMSIVDLAEERVAAIPGRPPAARFSLASIDQRGESYFGTYMNRKGRAVLFRVNVSTGKMDALHESESQNHIHVDPSGKTISFGNWTNNQGAACLIDSDGGHFRPLPFDRFAHCTWFGDTGKMQGTLLPPGHALVTYREGDAEPAVLTEGRYYWHSSSSREAQWIVSDTNWPQEGIYLFHVPTRTVTYVCDPRSSCSHPQWTHPHPSLSPGLKYVLFNSDQTGIGQVYLAELTQEFLAQASQGYECRPSPMS